jgi:hypothetical protein
MEPLTDEEFERLKTVERNLRKDDIFLPIANDMAVLIAEIDRLRQAEQFTVKVEIPPTKYGQCSIECDFYYSSHLLSCCTKQWNVYVHSTNSEPGPGCPRYEEEK